MRRFLVTSVMFAALLATPAVAAEDQARALCSRAERDHPLPAPLKDKIVLGQTATPSSLLFFDITFPTTDETEALADFDHALAPCRDAMLSVLESRSTRLAAERRALFARNEKILFDLMAKKFSFGEANRQWDEARMDFENRAAQLAAASTPVRVADDRDDVSPVHALTQNGSGYFMMPSGVSCSTKRQC